MSKTSASASSVTYCRLYRRLLVILYDLTLLLAVLFAFTLLIIPFNYGEALGSDNWLYHLFLLLVCCLYYCWHWTHGRNTLGMRSWRVQICTTDNNPLNTWNALWRFVCVLLSLALCGAGFAWALFDLRHRCLHDILSRTYLRVQ